MLNFQPIDSEKEMLFFNSNKTGKSPLRVLEKVKGHIERKVQKESCDQGFTLLEMLVSTFILSIILAVTVSMFVVYNTSFNASISLSKAQLQGETAMNSLTSYARSSIPCPLNTVALINYNPTTPLLAISAPFPRYSFTNTATPTTTTDIAVVTISLNKSTGNLKAAITPCPGYTGQTVYPVSVSNITSASFGFIEAQTNASGDPIWTSSNPPSITSSPKTPYSADNIIGLQMSIQVSVSGVSVTLVNTGYFNNFYCQGTSPPNGVGGGCVI
ncbi:MAG: prepilin-type N-terminal cleavage/methylation domain-containing protein [Acidimicrobiales bacterium]|nr:prepilin-type N-terminal cleavage/methylation domain-containing protein [Acidimicrobiales bacterium]